MSAEKAGFLMKVIKDSFTSKTMNVEKAGLMKVVKDLRWHVADFYDCAYSVIHADGSEEDSEEDEKEFKDRMKRNLEVLSKKSKALATGLMKLKDENVMIELLSELFKLSSPLDEGFYSTEEEEEE